MIPQYDIINEKLISHIKAGDQFAFELLFKILHKKLRAYATTLVGDTDIANDLIQETSIKIWEVRASLREDKSIQAYLFRSVHNNCINYLRISKN